MADSGNPTPTPRGPDKKDLSMEQRLLIAFALMGAVLFVSQYFFKPPACRSRASSRRRPAKPDATAAKPPTPAEPERVEAASAQAAGEEQRFHIETEVYSIELSNRGGEVRKWKLKKFTTGTGQPLELVNETAAPKVNYPFTLQIKDQKLPFDVNQVLYAPTPTPDGLGMDYVYSDGRYTVRKKFRFTKLGYLSQVTTEVANNGVAVPHLIVWRGGFGDPTSINASTSQHSVYFDVTDNKLIDRDAKAAKDGPVSTTGNYNFAGLHDQYFAAVFLPREPHSQTELETLDDSVKSNPDAKEEPHVGAGVGGHGVNNYNLFVGPKDIDLLRSIDPKLEGLVDFGRWFGFIAKPLFLAVNYVNDRITHNYGWAIVLVTIVINIAILPLRLASMKSMKKMGALQPEIAKINEKYKGMSLRDPKKAQQNEEMIALYKKHGVNPTSAAACPMVLQIPFFIAFYTVLTVAIEMRGAHWLWVTDLSQPETLPIRILPVVMIVSQFFQQKMTPQTSADPSQQRMMMLMPLMMGFFFYGMSSGLVLYWVTGNLVGIAQQWVFNRITPAPAPAVVDVKPVGKKSRK